MTKVRDCPHQWKINISVNRPLVICHVCGHSFFPPPQQFAYHGVVPKEFKPEP